MAIMTPEMESLIAQQNAKGEIGAKEAVELNILTLGSPITIHPPKADPFTLKAGSEGVILYRQRMRGVVYHSVQFSPDLPVQLIGYNSLHQYDIVKRHPEDMLKMVLQG